MTQQLTREQQIELLRGEVDSLSEQVTNLERIIKDVRTALREEGFSLMQRVARADRLRIAYNNMAATTDTLRRQFANLHPMSMSAQHEHECTGDPETCKCPCNLCL